jgi:hypothetical protein
MPLAPEIKLVNADDQENTQREMDHIVGRCHDYFLQSDSEIGSLRPFRAVCHTGGQLLHPRSGGDRNGCIDQTTGSSRGAAADDDNDATARRAAMAARVLCFHPFVIALHWVSNACASINVGGAVAP